MKLNLIVESKNFSDDAKFMNDIKKNPCEWCVLGQGPMCIDRSKCQWDTHQEIYIKKEVIEVTE